MAADQPAVIEVEDLLARVRVHAGGKAHRQSPPAPGPLIPGVELARGEALAREHKRRRDVRPYRVRAEVEDVQPIPPQLVAQVRERAARVLPALHDLAGIGLDAHRSVLLEDAALAGARVGREDHVLAPRGHPRLHVAHGGALQLGGKRKPTRGHVNADLARALPQLTATMSRYRELDQLGRPFLHGRMLAAGARGALPA